MATLEAQIKSMLTGITQLTGGIFTFGELPANGISRASAYTASAFDAHGYLKPCAVIKQGSESPITRGGIFDHDGNVQQLNARVSIYTYIERDTSGKETTTLAIKDAIYDAIQGKFVPSYGYCRLLFTFADFKDQYLNGAYSSRTDYMIRYTVSST